MSLPFRRSARNNLPKKRRIPGVLSDRDRKRQEREEKRTKKRNEEETAAAETEKNPLNQLLSIFDHKTEEHELSTGDEEDGEEGVVEFDGHEDEHEEHEEDDDEDRDDGDGDDTSELLTSQFRKHFAIDYDEEAFRKLLQDKTDALSAQCPVLGRFQLKNRPSSLPAFETVCRSIKKMGLKKVLETHAASHLSTVSNERSRTVRLEFLSLISQYADVSHLRRKLEDVDDVRWSYCLHILNHMLNVRQQILKNNAKIAKAKLQKKEIDDLETRDQGFSRARVLILLPFRESAKAVVQTFSSLLFGAQHDGQTLQMKRFLSEFSAQKELRDPLNKKPADFMQTFAGNTDDSFRIGLAVTKKSLKLFTDFYDSDVIICSPLALRMMITGEQPDYDFLSSLEILVLDQTEVFLMQNWEHVIEILKHLNLKPVNSEGIDFSRVKMQFLDETGRDFRQTIFLGSCFFNEAIALFNKSSHSFEGQVVFSHEVSQREAAVSRVFVKHGQQFIRHECSSLESCSNARFEHFTRFVLPGLRDYPHVLIYVSSYFDFVRLRNFMKHEEYNYVSLCEYTEEGKIAQGRSQFFKAGRRILLYTERFHFYRRFQVKGVRRVFFYQLPSLPQFYTQICNLTVAPLQDRHFTAEDEKRMSVSSFFCPFDAHRLAGILGSARTAKLLSSGQQKVTFASE